MASIRSAAFLAVLFRGGYACDTTKLAACDATAKIVIGNVGNVDKAANCGAQAVFERCYLDNAYDCVAATKTAWKQAVETSKNTLYGNKGIECSGALSTTMPLMSGDSGMPSGSQPHASSNMTYGWLAWQAIVLVCCIYCCCLAAGGGAAYYMGPVKKQRAKKAQRDYDLRPPETVPLAEVGVDINNDGKVDAIVIGEDKNRDGIPDALQGDDKAMAEVIVPPVVDPVPPMVPIVEPMVAEPNLFGPLPPLMPQAAPVAYPYTTSVPTTSYPAASYAAAGYPTTTTYAQPAYGYAGVPGGVI